MSCRSRKALRNFVIFSTDNHIVVESQFSDHSTTAPTVLL